MNGNGTISSIPTPDKGFLYGVTGGVILEFSVNPPQLQRQEQSNYNPSLSPGAAGPFVQYTGGGERNVVFELVLDAIGERAGDGGVLRELSILEAFTYPDTGDLDNAQFIPPPRALLGIGPRVWEGYVAQLQITEERFNVRMEPVYVRAQVTFVLDNWFNATNRRMHQMRRQRMSG